MSDNDYYYELDDRPIVIEREKNKLKRPSMYKVIIFNDDYTTADFVTEVLKFYFQKSTEEAIKIMFQVHKLGKGIAGIYTKDIAETKATQVMLAAKSHDFPLLLEIESE